jgi:hypothetical protein
MVLHHQHDRSLQRVSRVHWAKPCLQGGLDRLAPRARTGSRDGSREPECTIGGTACPLRPIQTKRNLEANVDLDGQNNRSNNGPWSKNLRGPWLAITGDAGTPCQRGIWGQIQMVEEKLGLTAPTRSCEQLTRQ